MKRWHIISTGQKLHLEGVRLGRVDLHLSEATTSTTTTTTTTTTICVLLWVGFVLVEEQLSQQENHTAQINELMEGFKNDASQSTDRWGEGCFKNDEHYSHEVL